MYYYIHINRAKNKREKKKECRAYFSVTFDFCVLYTILYTFKMCELMNRPFHLCIVFFLAVGFPPPSTCLHLLPERICLIKWLLSYFFCRFFLMYCEKVRKINEFACARPTFRFCITTVYFVCNFCVWCSKTHFQFQLGSKWIRQLRYFYATHEMWKNKSRTSATCKNLLPFFFSHFKT